MYTSRVRSCGRAVRLAIAVLLACCTSNTAQAQPQGSRLVVFEGFYRPT